jgi:ribosomal protein S18 acetylase RimI-like enzyme
LYKYRLFSSKDSDAVRELVRVTFPGFLDGAYWDWKHQNYPRFDPSLVAVAEENGEIVGCSHWLQNNLKLGSDVVVNSLLTCDLAVKSDRRGRGIAKNLLLQRRTRETFKKRGIVVNYDFADPKLAARLYTPLLGYLPTKLSTRKYFKLLSWKKIVDFVSDQDVQRALKKEFSKVCSLNMTISLKMRSAPQLNLIFKSGKIEATEGAHGDSDITIEGDTHTFISLMNGRNIKRKIVKAVLGRRIKFKGKLSKLLTAYRNVGQLEAVFKVIFTRDRDSILPKAVSRYDVRTFQDGDEAKIVQLLNKAYADYGGPARKGPEYWRWCCLERPDVERSGLFVAVDKHKGDVVGHVVAGRSGNVWELCYDPEQDGEEIVSLLVDKAVGYLEKAGVTSINITAPIEDKTIRRTCMDYGFFSNPPPKVFLSVLNLVELASLLANDKKEELTARFDETVLVKLEDAPSWISSTIFIKIGKNGVQVTDRPLPHSVNLETDFLTFSSLLFGNLSPSKALSSAKFRVTPSSKVSTLVEILSCLRMKTKWFFPLSEFG